MRRKLIVCAALLAGVGCWAQSHKSFTVLQAGEAQSVTRLCSRPSPQKVDGGWVPGKRDVAALEAHLEDIGKMSPRGLPLADSDRRHSYRQYVGIVVGGRRLIYINAFPPAFTKIVPDWKIRFMVDMCDGGAAYWGAVFDPATRTFSDLETSGDGPRP
jgi:hypothetical protein